MTYDEIIEQLEVTKSKIKEIARNEYGGGVERRPGCVD